MKKIISTSFISALLLPDQLEDALQSQWPLLKGVPRDAVSYVDQHRVFIINELQDEINESLSAIDGGKRPHATIKFLYSTKPRDKRYYYRFAFDDLPEDTRVHDIVLVESSQKQRFMGVVTEIDEERKKYHISVRQDQPEAVVWFQKRITLCRCFTVASMGPKKRCYDAVCFDYFPNPLFSTRLISGDISGCSDVTRFQSDPLREKLQKLNNYQKDAVLDFLHCAPHDLKIWMAPAGTGKSTTIVEAIFYELERNSSSVVLATAASNKAVLALMQKFVKIYPQIRVTFIGNEEKVSQYAPELTLFICRDKNGIKDKQVVFSTLNSLAKYSIPRVGALIIDEAGQATESESRIPLKHNPKKILLVGDPLQLPPTVKTDRVKEAGGDQSLLYRLIFTCKRPHHFFKDGYRMDPLINQWISRTIYRGRLTASYLPEVSISGPSLSLTRPPYMLINVKGAEKKIADSLSNRQEAIAVIAATKFLLQDSSLQSIAIITPYQGQVSVLNTLKNGLNDPRVQIGTIDSFQGSEADVVLLSLVRSNPSGNLGFVEDERRLNVALTRGKRATYVFCNTETLSKKPGICQKFIEDARLRDRIYQLSDLEDQKRLLIDTISDRLFQLNAVGGNPIFRISQIPPLRLAFQAYRHGVSRGWFQSPVQLSHVVTITNQSPSDLQRALLDFLIGMMTYRWDGGIGKGLELKEFSPQQLQTWLNLASLPESQDATLDSERALHVLWDAYEKLGLPHSEDRPLVDRFKRQGSRFAFTNREPIPPFVRRDSREAEGAILAFEQNRFETAAILYEKISDDPLAAPLEKAWALNMRAWAIYRQYGHPEGPRLARETLQKAIDALTPILNKALSKPIECKLHSDMGWVLYRMNNLSDAQAAYKEAEKLATETELKNPNIDLYNRWGQLCEAQGDLEGALSLYQKSCEKIPVQYTSFLKMGRIFALRGDMKFFEENFQKARNALEQLYQSKSKDEKHRSALQDIETQYAQCKEGR